VTDGQNIAGIVLAGGRSTRMGGSDKSGIELAGMSLLDRVIARLKPQVTVLGLNAASATDLADIDLVPDSIAGQPGPLAGIAAGLAWARTKPGITHLATAACDTPFLPLDLVERLVRADAKARIALARTSMGPHPTFALWPVALAGSIESHLAEGGSRRLLDYAHRHGIVAVDFDDAPFDPFFNVNTPQDLSEAGRIIREHGS